MAEWLVTSIISWYCNIERSIRQNSSFTSFMVGGSRDLFLLRKVVKESVSNDVSGGRSMMKKWSKSISVFSPSFSREHHIHGFLCQHSAPRGLTTSDFNQSLWNLSAFGIHSARSSWSCWVVWKPYSSKHESYALGRNLSSRSCLLLGTSRAVILPKK